MSVKTCRPAPLVAGPGLHTSPRPLPAGVALAADTGTSIKHMLRPLRGGCFVLLFYFDWLFVKFLNCAEILVIFNLRRCPFLKVRFRVAKVIHTVA